MADDIEYVSLNGLATALGLSYKSAKKHSDSGLWKPITHGRNAGKFPKAKCIELYEMSRDPLSVEKGDLAKEAAGQTVSQPMAGSALLKARTMSQVYEAKQRELKFKKAQGEVIDREEARRACKAVIGVVNERIEGAAAMIAARVAGNANVAECERIAKDVLRQVRVEIAAIGDALAGVGADA